MKTAIERIITRALDEMRADGELDDNGATQVHVERSRDQSHGDFSAPVAMSLAKLMRKSPREIAQRIVERIQPAPGIENIEIAGAGFINFFLEHSELESVVAEILDKAGDYGRTQTGQGALVQVEFVSATPTGPLHVGHGRGAAYGAVLANLLGAAGYAVQREYYVNDAGRQMDILALSIWLRYLEQLGESPPFPASAYQGDYIGEIASTLRQQHGDAFRVDVSRLVADLPKDEADGGDKEVFVDALISTMRQLISPQLYALVHEAGRESLLENIRTDLEEFGVVFDRWYSERSLLESGAVERALDLLRKSGHAYQRDGAIWFRSTDFGDDKDRVVIRENGVPTYFASDIAYHMEKFERGFARVIDVWGADHHGYIARVKGALEALGKDPDAFEVPIVQMVHLYRSGKKAFMSTRRGEFVTLRELREEVGNDAARFFYIMRRCEQQLDFDLDLAKSESNENPVYYLQYAHARICSVLRQAVERGYSAEFPADTLKLGLLQEPQEQSLMRGLARFPEVVDSAAQERQPHQIAFYLREIANEFHGYYNAHQFLVEDEALRNARLGLSMATRQVLANGLTLLGVSSPEVM